MACPNARIFKQVYPIFEFQRWMSRQYTNSGSFTQLNFSPVIIFTRTHDLSTTITQTEKKCAFCIHGPCIQVLDAALFQAASIFKRSTKTMYNAFNHNVKIHSPLDSNDGCSLSFKWTMQRTKHLSNDALLLLIEDWFIYTFNCYTVAHKFLPYFCLIPS